MNSKLLLDINSLAGKNGVLDNFMIFCASYLVYVVFVVAVSCLLYLVVKREWKPVIYFMATLAVTFILLQLMSMFNFDHRPFMDYHLTQLVAHASGKSFPSDHTTVTAGIAFGLLFFTRFKKLGVAVLVAACLIGFARVFVGIHYPLDILGGVTTGLVGGAVTFGIYKLIESKQKPRQVAREA